MKSLTTDVHSHHTSNHRKDTQKSETKVQPVFNQYKCTTPPFTNKKIHVPTTPDNPRAMQKGKKLNASAETITLREQPPLADPQEKVNITKNKILSMTNTALENLKTFATETTKKENDNLRQTIHDLEQLQLCITELKTEAEYLLEFNTNAGKKNVPIEKQTYNPTPTDNPEAMSDEELSPSKEIAIYGQYTTLGDPQKGIDIAKANISKITENVWVKPLPDL